MIAKCLVEELEQDAELFYSEHKNIGGVINKVKEIFKLIKNVSASDKGEVYIKICGVMIKMKLDLKLLNE